MFASVALEVLEPFVKLLDRTFKTRLGLVSCIISLGEVIVNVAVYCLWRGAACIMLLLVISVSELIGTSVSVLFNPFSVVEDLLAGTDNLLTELAVSSSCCWTVSTARVVSGKSRLLVG